MSNRERRFIGAHGTVYGRGLRDFAVDVDVKGELRERKNLSAYAYQRFGAGGSGGQFSREMYERKHTHGRIIPRPYPTQRFSKPWEPLSREIGNIPSVIVGGDPTPAKRQLRPQRISIDCNGTKRSSADFKPQSSDILLSGTRKARQDALRMTPFMNQLKISKGFPVINAVRGKIVQTIQRQRR